MKKSPVIPLVLSALLLAACGTTEEPAAEGAAADDPTSDGDGTQAAAEVTVTDHRGEEVNLEAPAERVVALEWAEAEMLATLGVMPVGVADLDGYATWNAAEPLDDDVENVGTRQEPSVDAIVALDPDLVVVQDGRGAALVDNLEEYVPVVVTTGSDASANLERMREDFGLLATATGTEDAAEQVLSDFEQSLSDGADAIEEAGAAGSPFAMADGWKEGSTVNLRMFGEGSFVSDLAEELGLQNAWTGEVDEMWGLGQTDVEGLSVLDDEDLHFFYSASEDDVFAEGLSESPIWNALPFVEAGNLTKLENGTWTFGGPASAESVIDQFVTAYQQ